ALERVLIDDQLVARHAERQLFFEGIPRNRATARTQQRATRDLRNRRCTERRGEPTRQGGTAPPPADPAPRPAPPPPPPPPDRGAHAGLLRIVSRERIDLPGRCLGRYEPDTCRRDAAKDLLRAASRISNRVENPNDGMHAHRGQRESCRARLARERTLRLRPR